MLPEIERLLILQDRDTKLAELKENLERIPRERELAKARLQSSQAGVAKAKEAQQENEVAIKQIELDAETRRNTIGRLKTQQFETRKNEEFRALGTEIERYEAEIDNLETKELDLMEKGDELRDELKSAQDALAKAEAHVEELLSDLDQREQSDLEQQREFQEKRAAAEKSIEDESILSTYKRLFKSRGKNMVAILSETGQCKSCHMKATPATSIAVNADKEIIHCENCGCFLYPG